MNIWETPQFWIPVIVAGSAVFLWANRCPKCGKFFSQKLRNREKIREGSRQVWRKSGSSAQLKSEYTYVYLETYVCTTCCAETKTTVNTTSSRSTGSFAVAGNDPTSPDQPLAPSWFSRIPGKRIVLSFVLIFLLGMIGFDPEVLWYPTQIQSYAESFIDFLQFPLKPRWSYRTRLTLVGGNWTVWRGVEEFREVEKTDWLENIPSGTTILASETRERPIVGNPMSMANFGGPKKGTWIRYRGKGWETVEMLSASGTDLSLPLPGVPIPPPAELVVGSRRSNHGRDEFSVTLKDPASGKTFTTSRLLFLRESDLHQEGPWELTENLYRRLMTEPKEWQARIVTFREEDPKRPLISLYVKEIPGR